MPRALDFDRCHRLAHRWDELPAPPVDLAHLAHAHPSSFWLRCDSCLMVRGFEISTTTGDVVWNRYFPQPGYYWDHKATGTDAPLKADYRLDWLRAKMSKTTARAS